MKQAILLIAILTLCTVANAQHGKLMVNWATPEMYTVKNISFETDSVSVQCPGCKCMELNTPEGVTGIFLFGNSKFSLKSRKMEDATYACLLRFNPEDIKRYIKKNGSNKLNDKGFHAVSINLLETMFMHSYHSKKDALIPNKGEYTVDVFASQHGNLLISFAADTTLIYNFTTKRNL